MVFGGRWAGLSLLEASDLLGFSHATISRIFREWSEKEKLLASEQKCLVHARVEWPACFKSIERQQ